MSLNSIMLVDDEPRLLSGIRRRLSGDFEVVTFESGSAALEYLSNPNDIKVIVADMQMPEMNGIELLKRVSDIAPDIRRLMLTGNSDQETAMAAINEGKVFRFIRKPCEASELKTIVNQAIKDYEFQKSDLSERIDEPSASSKYVDVQKNFLSVINDELRTPLSQIITMSEVLDRDAIKLNPQKLSEFLNQINRNGIFALRQVDRILEYTRLQSDNSKASVNESCDIVQLCHAAIESVKPGASDKLITFSMESLRKTAHIKLPRRPSAMMLQELMDNAVKFSPFGGHVSVMLKYDKERLAVRIFNDGTSKLPESKSTQFHMEGMQLDRLHGGLGLGLSLVHSIAEKYNVRVDHSNSEGRGTAVILTLPRALPSELRQAG